MASSPYSAVADNSRIPDNSSLRVPRTDDALSPSHNRTSPFRLPVSEVREAFCTRAGTFPSGSPKNPC